MKKTFKNLDDFMKFLQGEKSLTLFRDTRNVKINNQFKISEPLALSEKLTKFCKDKKNNRYHLFIDDGAEFNGECQNYNLVTEEYC